MTATPPEAVCAEKDCLVRFFKLSNYLIPWCKANFLPSWEISYLSFSWFHRWKLWFKWDWNRAETRARCWRPRTIKQCRHGSWSNSCHFNLLCRSPTIVALLPTPSEQLKVWTGPCAVSCWPRSLSRLGCLFLPLCQTVYMLLDWMISFKGYKSSHGWLETFAPLNRPPSFWQSSLFIHRKGCSQRQCSWGWIRWCFSLTSQQYA